MIKKDLHFKDTLHSHPAMERNLKVPKDHCIIDKDTFYRCKNLEDSQRYAMQELTHLKELVREYFLRRDRYLAIPNSSDSTKMQKAEKSLREAIENERS